MNRDFGNKAAFARPSSDGNPPLLGLTKREYFAGLAMQGLCASGMKDYEANDGYVGSQPLVGDALRIADELLKQLEYND